LWRNADDDDDVLDSVPGPHSVGVLVVHARQPLLPSAVRLGLVVPDESAVFTPTTHTTDVDHLLWVSHVWLEHV